MCYTHLLLLFTNIFKSTTFKQVLRLKKNITFLLILIFEHYFRLFHYPFLASI